MRFEIRKTCIPGCLELAPAVHRDLRGIFVKTFNFQAFKDSGLETGFKEEYYSVSGKGVLRGMHLQVSPRACAKLVYCPRGRVFDALLDLRSGSPSRGKCFVLELSSEKANMIYVPKGVAHGFYCLTKGAILVYKTSCGYSPSHDTGVLWNSAAIPWPVRTPLVSKRDAQLPPLSEFLRKFAKRSRL